ncbi:hypothetical protein THAOC_33016, partial [Thalassiosira oceanica]
RPRPLPDVVGDLRQVPLAEHVVVDELLRDDERVLAVVVPDLELPDAARGDLHLDVEDVVVPRPVDRAGVLVRAGDLADLDPGPGRLGPLRGDRDAGLVEDLDLPLGPAAGERVHLPLGQLRDLLGGRTGGAGGSRLRHGFLEAGDRLGRREPRRVPGEDPDVAVVARRDEVRAPRRADGRHPPDAARVAQRLDGPSRSRDVPDDDVPVLGTGRHGLRLRASHDADREEHGTVGSGTRERRDGVARLGRPDPHGAVVAARVHRVSVGVVRHVSDRAVVVVGNLIGQLVLHGRPVGAFGQPPDPHGVAGYAASAGDSGARRHDPTGPVRARGQPGDADGVLVTADRAHAKCPRVRRGGRGGAGPVAYTPSGSRPPASAAAADDDDDRIAPIWCGWRVPGPPGWTRSDGPLPRVAAGAAEAEEGDHAPLRPRQDLGPGRDGGYAADRLAVG